MHASAIIFLALGVASRASTIPAQAALDLGSCSDPTIAFGIQGRKEASFQANNLVDFNHGSALAIGFIANFICSQLGSNCKAGADATAACTKATAAASKSHPILFPTLQTLLTPHSQPVKQVKPPPMPSTPPSVKPCCWKHWSRFREMYSNNGFPSGTSGTKSYGIYVPSYGYFD
jgi:hypothetical protein